MGRYLDLMFGSPENFQQNELMGFYLEVVDMNVYSTKSEFNN